MRESVSLSLKTEKETRAAAMPDPHSLTDHAMGALAAHQHGDGEFDHDHDGDFYLDAQSKSLESVEMVSIGVDIGSSSAQVAFSKIVMRGPGEHRALRGRPKDRQTLYLSPIAPTPFRGDGSIDETRLRAILDSAFAAAKLTPDDIETGAVVLTGEAAARANAEAIAHVVSEDVGDLVCAAAGHHMEAVLAAHGSGAVDYSRREGGKKILLIDIGGATTKFALIDAGNVMATAALAAGGRLIVIDKSNVVARVDAAGAEFARRAGFDWRVGDAIDPRARADIGELMANAIVEVAAGETSDATRALFLTDPLPPLPAIDAAMFSGGVGEYVYAREKRDFGDLGRALGQAVRARLDAGALPFSLAPPGECIRATVLGASEHSVQLSGDTIFISSHAALLPVRGLAVLRPPLDLAGDIAAGEVAAEIARHRAAFGKTDPLEKIALSLPWRGAPEYARARALCEGLAAGLADMIAARTPIYIVTEGDIALTLGAILKRDMVLASDVLVVDGIAARTFDFVDIGRLRMPSHTVPVTIKSLLFGGPGDRGDARSKPSVTI